MNNKLDISPLKNSIEALEKSIGVFNSNIYGNNIDVRNTLRSGIIHNFETAYLLCWKFMKRWLEINVSPDIVIETTQKEFYRIANGNRLISDVAQWWEFHDSRNKTSHTYSCDTAEEVFESAIKFLAAAIKFAADLESKI